MKHTKESPRLLCPSMMCAGFDCLAQETETLDRAGADIFHLDVMDGHFVHNFGLGLEDIQCVRRHTSKPIDAHLMVSNPGEVADLFLDLGVDILYIHWEAEADTARTLSHIRERGGKSGLVLNPGTSLEAVEGLLPWTDYLLLMTVTPGFSGQKYQPAVEEKIQKAAIWKERYHYCLAVDGAISPSVIQRLAPLGVDGFKVDFSQIDVTFTSLFESIAVAILSTVYSLVGGMVLAVFLAKNLTPFKWMAAVLSAVLTFLRAIPSIIWVLLILVCVGFGPSAGIIGICIFSTSFFARSFAQCYEEVPQETLEALRAMGAGRVKVFFSAVLPSAFTGMLAWTSISFESNFEASAVLGTVGAGGIGYVISNCMTRYAYGQAIVAIALVLAFTYAMELGFTAIKERNGKIK